MERRCTTPQRLPLFRDLPCGGLLVFDRLTYTTGPDTRWREQPVVLIDLHCRTCGARHGDDRKPATDEERALCFEALRRETPVLFVGEAPGRTPGPAFWGRGGARIRALAPSLAFKAINLLDRWPGSAGRGARFPRRAAEDGRGRVLAACQGVPVVLFAGRRVARVFGLARAPYFRFVRLADGGRRAVVPHPSGVNRWWNDPANVRRARRFLGRLARDQRRR